MLYEVKLRKDGPIAYVSGKIRLERGRVVRLDLTDGQKVALAEVAEMTPIVVAAPPAAPEAPKPVDAAPTKLTVETDEMPSDPGFDEMLKAAQPDASKPAEEVGGEKQKGKPGRKPKEKAEVVS